MRWSVRPWSGARKRADQQCEEQDGQKDAKHEPGDLPGAPRPFADDLPGAAVDQDLKDRIAVAVGGDPGRQQRVLERDPRVLRLLVIDPLVVSADVLAD